MTKADDARGSDEAYDQVDAWLREASRLSEATTSWPPHVDMSAEAVTGRLLDCAEISALALDLAWAGAAARA